MKKKNIKKILALAFCCVMLVPMLAACGDSNGGGGDTSSPPAGTPTSSGGGGNTGGTLVSAKDSVNMAITADTQTLNPLYLNGWAAQQCIFQVYEPLWFIDGSRRNIVPRLATGYDMSPDGLVWTVYLREGVTFSNGEPFVASDVLFSLHLANNREGEPPWFVDMVEERNRVIDENTVEIHFSRFLISYEASFGTIPIFSEASYDPDTVSMTAIGTGPYTITDYVINSHLIMTARDDYWGGKAPIQTLNYRFISEESQRVNAIEAGEVDVSDIPFAEIEHVENLPNIDVRLVPRFQTRCVLLNNTNPDSPFYDNADARAAFLYAVNPEPILRIVYNGYGEVSKAAYTLFAGDANESDFYYGLYSDDGYNPDRARELAISSGLAEWSQNNQLRLINNGAPDMVNTAELIQGMLEAVGVRVQIVSYDTGSWLTYRFDHTAYELTVDFTGGTLAASDLTLWWQYCGNNSDSSGNPDPAGLERLRELTGGDRASGTVQAIGEEPNAANRVAGITEMNRLINDQYLFKNLVDMMNAMALHQDLSLTYLSGEWVDWTQSYWVR